MLLKNLHATLEATKPAVDLKQLEPHPSLLLEELQKAVAFSLPLEFMPSLNESLAELYALAYRLYVHGNYQKALDIFHVLTRLQSHQVNHWLGLAAAQQMLKMYAAALDAYSVAALLDVENPYIHFYAANCCLSMGDIKKGLQAIYAAELVACGKVEYANLCVQLALIREAWTSNTKTVD